MNDALLRNAVSLSIGVHYFVSFSLFLHTAQIHCQPTLLFYVAWMVFLKWSECKVYTVLQLMFPLVIKWLNMCASFQFIIIYCQNNVCVFMKGIQKLDWGVLLSWTRKIYGVFKKNLHWTGVIYFNNKPFVTLRN